MERLPAIVQKQFLLGNHVMRHQPGIWNGIWSDMFIETTFMRYGHGPGGIIGITLQPSTLTRWALSLHLCSQLMKDVSLMAEDSQKDIVTHKEEMPHRIRADNEDRAKLRARIKIAIDPLDPHDHPAGIINIVTGRIATDNVTVDQSVTIGQQQMVEFESSWPEGFHNTISKKVITMSTMKKHIKVGNTQVYDTNLIYSRVMGLQSSRDISMKDVLKYELSPVPTSMYEDNGGMRITKTKSVLKQKLQVEHSSRTGSKCEVVIIDGSALLWVIHWPASGNVSDFAESYTNYLARLMADSHIYLVFDRYYESSINGETRAAGARNGAVKRHVLNAQTLLPSQKVTLGATENKIQLIELICQYIKDQCHMLPSTNKLVVTSQNPVPFEICNGVVLQRVDLRTTHEEADVIIVQQVVKLAEDGVSSMKVICDDTDVFILLIHYYAQEHLTCDLIMCGTSSRRVIDIKATTDKHSTIVDQLLPAHALSGCDTVSQMYGIGKGTVLKVIRSRNPLNKLGKISARMDEVIEESVRFVAACYGSRERTNMSAARYDIWTSKMANKKLTTAPQLKTLPPTTEAFDEHVHRAHFQVAIWRSALQQDPPNLNPRNFGWSLDEASQSLDSIPLPADVLPAPPDVLQLIKCGCASEQPCSTARCGCYAARLSCSIFCACHGEHHCKNTSNSECIEYDCDDDGDTDNVNLNND